MYSCHGNLSYFTGKAVVITSHSMAECEVLCSRIGIMVAGRLRCLGSAQHLRDKYGNGYVIQLKLNPQGYDLHKVIHVILVILVRLITSATDVLFVVLFSSFFHFIQSEVYNLFANCS